MRIHYFCIFFFSVLVKLSLGQSPVHTSSADILSDIERLNVLGSVLYFAAHPDDENTKLIAYLASERKVRTAYISLTRGDGGQNLIGTEQGIELGLIRTQELMQARKIDRGEQYFSSAYDFGFSKTYDETFSFWKKQDILREAVWIIRKLQPDVIITRFPPDERGGHGHHQASAILAHEAFKAAADPKMFPEQLQHVEPWQAKRLLWNTANFMRMQGDPNNQLKIDIGDFNPLFGQSYGEIAALSRSQHKSQGFGSASSNGRSLETFEYVDGEKAMDDLFDGIDISWNRVQNGPAVQTEIQQLLATFNPNKPQQAIPQLKRIWQAIQQINNKYWKERKSREVENLMLACAGIKIESLTEQERFAESEPINFQTELIVRNPDCEVKLLRVNDKEINQLMPTNEAQQIEASLPAPAITQPYWLQKPNSLGRFDVDPKDVGYPINPDLPQANIQLEIAGIPIHIDQPLQYRYVDPVRGEIREYIEVVPNVTASIDTKTLLVRSGEQKTILATFERHTPEIKSTTINVSLSSKTWKVSPETITLSFDSTHNLVTQPLEITNIAANDSAASLTFVNNKGNFVKNIREIGYNHIPKQTWFPNVNVKLEPLAIVNPVKRVGYIMGAGDLVPDALRNIGTTVDILDIAKISKELLTQYDALIFGVRVLNVEPNVSQKLPIIFDYVRDGGVVVMQYNVNTRILVKDFAPKPFTVSRARVTDEKASVKFTDPKDAVLNYPNKITAQDFDNWIQERGLYFAEEIDPSYRTPLGMADKNEPLQKGSLLVSRLGKGKFVYTSLSFFRQLPAGIPGAYRLFVNLLAKEQ